jgi:MFS family permease
VTNDDTITIAAYVFYNLVFALASYPLGAIADKFSFKRVFLSGLLLFAVVYTGFALNPSTLVIFGLFFIYGIYAAATEGITKAWITNIAHSENTATAIGFYTSCESICTLVASIIAGILWTRFGSFYTFFIPAMVALVVFIYFLLKIRRN